MSVLITKNLSRKRRTLLILGYKLIITNSNQYFFKANLDQLNQQQKTKRRKISLINSPHNELKVYVKYNLA